MEAERLATLPSEEKLQLADQEVTECSEDIVAIQKKIHQFCEANHTTVEMLFTGRCDLTGPLSVGQPERSPQWQSQAREMVEELYAAEQRFHVACSRFAGLKDLVGA